MSQSGTIQLTYLSQWLYRWQLSQSGTLYFNKSHQALYRWASQVLYILTFSSRGPYILTGYIGDSSPKHSISYFSDGTANGGTEINDKTDYVSQSGTLQFNHSETSKTITIEINKKSKVMYFKHEMHIFFFFFCFRFMISYIMYISYINNSSLPTLALHILCPV